MLYVEHFFVSMLTRNTCIAEPLGARGRRPVKSQGWKGGEKIE